MIKRIFNKLILPLGLCLFIAVPAFAGRPQSEGPDHKRSKGGHIGQIIKQLNLSQDQKSQVKPLVQKFRTEAKPMRKAMVEAQLQVAQIMFSDPFSESQARAAFRNAAHLKENMMIARAKLFSQVKTILTPEQLAKLDRIKSEKLEKMRAKIKSHQREDSGL